MNGADPTPKPPEDVEANSFAIDQFLEDLADVCADLYLEEAPTTVVPAAHVNPTKEPEP